MMNGKVYLIGAGPGDPGLFTLKGKSILEAADVVVYDRLVSPSILAFCNEKAKMVDVGKMPTHHKVKQSEINKLLVKFAQEMPGATIARLKGGDPFVFGRGGEEGLELVEAGIEFEVVPGITSAISVPAYAGIPVSHRGIATSFHIITGHEREDGEAGGLDFDALAKCPGTLIFLMGISNMETISRRLIECGKDPKTPLAFIEKGTTPYQRTVTCTLETAGETIVRENVTAPAITIMGGVVELGNTLAWRKKMPLSGKRLVVTRAAKQSSGITARLTALGAEVIETPMIETRGVEPRVGSLDGNVADFADLANFDVLAFTSTNGVESFFESLFKAGLDIRVLAGKKIASVGKITEKKLQERGIRCDYVPEDHTGEGLGKLLASMCASVPCHSELYETKNFSSQVELCPLGRSTKCEVEESSIDESRILLLQGNLADDTLTTLLPKAIRWVVYETLPVTEMPDWKREAVATADAVVFASSSAVENFVKLLPQSTEGVISIPSAQSPRLAFSIGRMTTATAKKYGFEVVESEETTMDSLVKKVVEYESCPDHRA
ncbi:MULTISPECIES: uroporphyrinogen-III C-methyltransferase [unclassified Fibrobacter]|uniref:uroporphyrinogen-III C-methyltransferase n=1 Tax=unclassified Fibrobacter TaxID=2634177 RepID=UPI000D6D5DFB|nr:MULTISPECIES: uroporphyrinogen-III C-methyltransferase [unclassified Fibrobacter]PWJ69966.1 uroporphyrinogen III methyltransferase/synthase [Fibrobacter sp. UWR4]PZW73137.1 uroporphyrinogen III methyltransferase/synthase [Fibrobacter sp. UWR1]